MKNISPQIYRKTSVSLPRTSHRRLLAAARIFRRNGVFFSEQEIYRRLLKLFLKNWRGSGLKTNALRRYSARGRGCAIHPFYVNQVLYAALWQRSAHSGESVSRMLDFSIRVYLPRLLAEILRSPNPASRRLTVNSPYWAARYQKLQRKYSDFFINYFCRTAINAGGSLNYIQEMQIIPKSNLSVMQIWDLLHRAA